MIKERQKENTKLPPHLYLSAKVYEKERERKSYCARTRTKKTNTFSSHCFLSSSRPTYPYPTKNSKHIQIRRKARRKEAINKKRGGGRKKEELASKSTSKNSIKHKSIPCINCHFEVGGSKQDLKSYLNAS